MHKLIRRGIVISGVAILSMATVGVVVAAPSTRAAEAQTSAQEHKAAAQTRLADVKLKVCENREKVINNIMARIADRGQKQLDLFTTIATRVETFYTDKGKTLDNYDELVADVTTKKDAAQTTVDAVKSSSVDFKCDGTDPKGAAAGFKDALKAEIVALKTYKTSVKNLIVGVKSVQGSTSSTENQTEGEE